jgi:hypothetical protein
VDLQVGSSHGFAVGDDIIIGNQETKRIVSFGSIRIDTPLKYGYGLGTEIRKVTNSAAGLNPIPASSPDGFGGGFGSGTGMQNNSQSSSGIGSSALTEQLKKLDLHDRDGHPMRYEKHALL